MATRISSQDLDGGLPETLEPPPVSSPTPPQPIVATVDGVMINTETLSHLVDLVDQVARRGDSDRESDSVAWLTDSSHVWDLAIVDLFITQGTGMGVIAACKNRSVKQKIVVLSNYATPDVRKQCLQLGADAVFDKSTEIELLLAFCNQLKNP